MKIMKYILFALLLLALWITEPLWMKKHTDTSSSPIDTQISEQNHQRAIQLASEAAKLNELETKFGPKPYGRYSTGVPSEVYEYWNKTLQYPDSLQEERCGPIRSDERGWTTVCRYRAKNHAGSLELMQDTFIIKEGKATK
ncbi:hypothetical protein [Sulfurovum sp. TSL1]|uniref:hypothetical protein n=1 Tax=Sulfurovum sp. TSL1 TaxID=2826994 RepID=UPI001CC4921E|nr:hypothetical protein [Sulfurovum sp. TSL1]GIT97650.1 hypothetical protein TSL1_04710 [Sulfurovum sp. TSL1]